MCRCLANHLTWFRSTLLKCILLHLQRMLCVYVTQSRSKLQSSILCFIKKMNGSYNSTDW